jgi:CRP/FNR family cyclic AMP-dependent transcriptional regulator
MVNFLWENIFKRAQHENDISALLKENILFQDLSKRELKFVENIVHIRHYRSDENVFRQGEIGIGMYIIVKGSIDIIVADLSLEEDTTKDTFITRLVAGDFFGELSLVEDNGPRSATAKAHEDTILIGFFKPDLLEILERSPTAGVKILFRLAVVLGKRLKETTDKISQLRKELRLLRHQRFPRGQGTQNESEPNSTET